MPQHNIKLKNKRQFTLRIEKWTKSYFYSNKKKYITPSQEKKRISNLRAVDWSAEL